MKVSEENVLGQGGVFMLFYDCIEPAKLMLSKPMQVTETPKQSGVEESILEPIEVQQISVPEQAIVSDPVAIAANVPLPGIDDDDLSDSEYQDSILTTREESIATSVSEFDDDETVEQEEQDYQPAKAIVIPPFIQQTGVHTEAEGVGQQKILSPGSLLMV
jgi:ubiquitin carboxyl-terminal hydrolase 1